MLECLFLHHHRLRVKSDVGTDCGLWRAPNLTDLRSVEQWGDGDIVHVYTQLVITVVIRKKNRTRTLQLSELSWIDKFESTSIGNGLRNLISDLVKFFLYKEDIRNVFSRSRLRAALAWRARGIESRQTLKNLNLV